jgi:cell division protein ZapA
MNQELTVTLLDKTLSVACPPGQSAALLESAQLLNKQMLKVQRKKPSASLLNVALIAALNISYELLEQKNQHLVDEQSMNRLSELLSQALSG